MTMMLVNLTPHTVNVILPSGEVRDIPASGQVARCRQSDKLAFTIDGVIPVTYQTFGNVEGLPDRQDKTFYIVSRLVAAACPDRKDLLIPGPLVRNSEGQPIGCQGLSIL